MCTVILLTVGKAMFPAATTAVSCVALTNVVGRLAVPHHTADPFTKFEPLTVRLKPAPPAVVDAGARLVIAGAGGGARLVRWKSSGAAPVALAVTAYAPATALAVAFTLAASGVIVTVLLERAALAPVTGAEKVITPPFTGSEKLLLTPRDRGWTKAVLIRASWLFPPVIARVNPRDSKAPMSQAAP